MSRINKMTAICAALLISCLISPAALAANSGYGAEAVDETQTYTLEQMLNLAIEDEYLAMTRYEAFAQKFGDTRPLIKIVGAERAHIAVLKPLFSKYRFEIPQNKASQFVSVPGTLLEVYKLGYISEKKSVTMYELFLRHDLPENVRIIFTVLKNAAGNHLKAFEKAIARMEGRYPGTM